MFRRKLPIYWLRADSDKYAKIVREDEYWELFGPPSVEHTWREIRCSVDDSSSHILGDFPPFHYGGIPAISERAWKCLAPLVGDAAVALPLGTFDGQNYFLLQILNIVDALNVDRSEVGRLSTGEVLRVSRFAYKEDKLKGHHLFKVPEARTQEPQISKELRRLIRNNKLRGACMSPVYQ